MKAPLFFEKSSLEKGPLLVQKDPSHFMKEPFAIEKVQLMVEKSQLFFEKDQLLFDKAPPRASHIAEAPLQIRPRFANCQDGLGSH